MNIPRTDLTHPIEPAARAPLTRHQPIQRWVIGLLWMLLTVCFFRAADTAMDSSLDSSNYGSYTYFTSHGFNYGRDVVAMAGPYGFIPYGYVYTGEWFGVRLAMELLVKGALAALVIWFFRASPAAMIIRCLWLVTVVTVAPLIEDTPYDLTVLLAGLYLTLRFSRDDRLVHLCLVGALLALLSLCKGTQLVLAATTLGLIAIQAVLMRRLVRFGWIALSFAGTYLVLWLLAGQNPLNIPGFLHGIQELSSGYNNAMGMQEPPVTTRAGLLILSVLSATLLFGAWRCRRNLAHLLACAFFGAIVFVQWKHGFVRADGHIFIFFHFALIGALMPFLIAASGRSDSPRFNHFLHGGITAICVVITANGAVYGETSGAWINRLTEVIPANFRHLLDPLAARTKLEAQLAANRKMSALPMLRERIGDGTVDFFGSDHGYVLLNNLNYHPRPMGGGSFGVYTEYLKRLNEAFLRDPARRPHYYLFKAQSVDDRLATQDDSRALHLLLHLYQPVEIERDILLFAQNPSASPPAEPVLIREQTFAWGETITVPAANPTDVVLATFDFELNWLGRLRAFFYKPPQIHLNIVGEQFPDGSLRRLIPAMLRSPVILNPALENVTDVLALYGNRPGKKVERVLPIASHPSLYRADRLKVRFYQQPRPSAASRAEELIKRVPFTLSNLAPELVEPPGFFHFVQDGFVVGLHAPSRIVFPLSGDERDVTLSFGVEPDAYLKGKTDGVEFLVELVKPDVGTHPLFKRYLRPREIEAERGIQTHRVQLPPSPPGSKIIVRTEIGPNNDGGWDWSYFTQINFGRGPYRLEQFPGFSVAPNTVEAPYSGALTTEVGEVFMMNAPGLIRFDLTGDEKTLAFSGGLLPGSYTGAGQSNGATFIAELRDTSGTVQTISQRLLQPGTVESDRGMQDFNVAIPPHVSGAQLIVRIDAGPEGNASWDWTYLTNLHIK